MIANCHTCRKPFAARHRELQCPACVTEEQQDYHHIYQFLLRRPASDIETISKETGIAKERVLKQFQDGKFVQSEKITCTLCRQPLAPMLNSPNGLCRPCVDQRKSELLRSLAPKPVISSSRPVDERRYGLGR